MWEIYGCAKRIINHLVTKEMVFYKLHSFIAVVGRSNAL